MIRKHFERDSSGRNIHVEMLKGKNEGETFFFDGGVVALVLIKFTQKKTNKRYVYMLILIKFLF